MYFMVVPSPAWMPIASGHRTNAGASNRQRRRQRREFELPQRDRLGRNARRAPRRSDRALPPGDVAPGPVLEADLGVHAHVGEAGGAVQRDAAVVGERDSRVGAVEALPFEDAEQGLVE